MSRILRVCALGALLLGLTVEVRAQCHLLLLGAGTCGSAATFDPQTSLVAYWSMEEASGTAIDAHAANDLAETGSPNTIASATGVVSNARDCERDDTEYFTIADNADLSVGDIDFTVAGWVNMESAAAALWGVAGKWVPAGDQREYLVYFDNAATKLVFTVSATGTSTTTVVNASTTQTTATWYFFVAWHDTDDNKIYLQINDGTVAEAAHTTGVFATGTGGFDICSFSGNANHFDGLVDEVGFWKKTLASDERTWLYNSGSGRSYTDIVNYVP